MQRVPADPTVRSSAVRPRRRAELSNRRLQSRDAPSPRDADYPAITKEFDVGSSDYQAAKETGKARVTYLPEDPQVSRVTDFEILPFQILLGLGGLMTLAGLFCLAHLLMTRAKA